ncbi:hypothetical protein ACIQXQ_19985 [Peribacillus sp. NPDC097198]|uniref:hypothetical protein n=1 Tax=Peribacillus sp. NPDC097198 TaxID=3364397 RepID=UPI0038064705
MKNIENRKIWYTALLVVGATLYILAELMELIDSFWSGMGLGFVVISGLRLVQIARYKNNDEYAKKITVANNDERNQFLANKARSTAFYNSILLEAIVGIVLHIIGKAEIAQVILTVLCGQLIIYWVTYVFLKSKY